LKSGTNNLNTPPNFALFLWVLALSVSALYGFKAFELHNMVSKKPDKNETEYNYVIGHQIWFNFCGALLGWIATWILLNDAWPCLHVACKVDLNWSKGILSAVAFAGVTGYLPNTLITTLQTMNEIALKLIGLISK
jgi:uncharacterized Tic20 family protein